MVQIYSNTNGGPFVTAHRAPMIPQISSVAMVLALQLSMRGTDSEIRNSWMGCCPACLAYKDAHWRFLRLCKYVQLHWRKTLLLSRCDFFHPNGHLSMSFAATGFHKLNHASLDDWYTMALWYSFDRTQTNYITLSLREHVKCDQVDHKLSCKHDWTAATHGIQLR